MKHRFFLIISFLFLCISLPAEDAIWKTIVPNMQYEFPRDHGSHPEYRTEWWYVTGNIESEDDRPFGYQLTFFRQGMMPDPPLRGESNLRPRQIFFAHFAIADIQTGRFLHTKRFRRPGGGLAWASEETLDVGLEDWYMRMNEEESFDLYALDPEQDFEIDFQLQPIKPLVFQGIDGFSRKGYDEGNASSYLSWTRMDTKGTLRIGKNSFEIQGQTWFDHEWGTSQLGEGVVGWDWFGLRLDDQRELMIYQLRDEEGRATEHSAGTLVHADGSSTHLTQSDFTIESLQTWKSPITKGEYPSEWIIRIPSQNMDLRIETLIDDAELNDNETSTVVYWEGPVNVSGTVTGQGYAELTGYAGSLAKRF